MERDKISQQKGFVLNADDRLEIARLLIKAGYSVKITKEKPNGKSIVYSVEYWEEEQ